MKTLLCLAFVLFSLATVVVIQSHITIMQILTVIAVGLAFQMATLCVVGAYLVMKDNIAEASKQHVTTSRRVQIDQRV
jgi:hypothetical protein